MIIAIDGPAGAGKSTVAKIIAKKLGFLYIDTGAMYRAITLKALDQEIDIKDSSALVDIAHSASINLDNDQDGSVRVFLNGKEVTKDIRSARISRYVSDVAKIKEVRQIMLKLQRQLGLKSDAVLDGRDIGTVVFPDAQKKFYIDADFKERVQRRYKELNELGENVTPQDIERDLCNRDRIDSNRKFAPLKKADDAIYVATTHMTIEEVVEELLKQIGINPKSLPAGQAGKINPKSKWPKF